MPFSCTWLENIFLFFCVGFSCFTYPLLYPTSVYTEMVTCFVSEVLDKLQNVLSVTMYCSHCVSKGLSLLWWVISMKRWFLTLRGVGFFLFALCFCCRWKELSIPSTLNRNRWWNDYFQLFPVVHNWQRHPPYAGIGCKLCFLRS